MLRNIIDVGCYNSPKKQKFLSQQNSKPSMFNFNSMFEYII